MRNNYFAKHWDGIWGFEKFIMWLNVVINIYIDQMSQSTGEIVYEGHVSSESSFGSRTGHSRG